MKILLFNKKINSETLFKVVFSGGVIKVGVALLVLMMGGYIFQISEMTKKTYAIQRYAIEIESVLDQNRDQEYSFLRSNSLSRAEMLIKESDFEKVNKIHYIEIQEQQVALK
jgi:hypothetical protein